MTWFDAMCRRRHEAGVREHRGGDADAPFSGDPLACAIEELADFANYLREAARAEGLVGDVGDWPVGWQNRWNANREAAHWVRQRILERDKRHDGGIRWECGNLDEAGPG